MPFFIPISVKVAITAGAIIGGSIAVLNNKERLLEFGEQVFQGGADFCRSRIKQHRQNGVLYADEFLDGAFEDYESETDENGTDFADTDISTPDASDHEWEHDLDTESLD